MAEVEPFDAAAALADLHSIPQPQDTHGPTMAHAHVGETYIRLVSDGAMSLPFRALGPDAPVDALTKMFGLNTAPSLGRGEITSVLLEVGDALILVDAGAGHGWQAGAGRLQDHLATNAIAAETITHLVLTHLHPDHAWGALTSAGHPAFPNARVFVGKREAAFWDKPGLADRVQPAFRRSVEGAVQVLRALEDKLVMLEEGDEISPGLSTIDTPGHSPGHISLFLDDGEGLIVTGDALVSEIVSFQQPDWAFGFDTDAEMAVKARRRLLDMAADRGHAMMGCHWNWPGVGHTSRHEGAYKFSSF